VAAGRDKNGIKQTMKSMAGREGFLPSIGSTGFESPKASAPLRVDSASMARRIPLSRMAFWGAWVLAGGVGYVLPYLGATLGWFGPIYINGDYWIANVVGAALVAFPQYVVLRLLMGHRSLAGAMWIPVSAVAWLAAGLAGGVSAEWIASTLLSVGAIQATPGPFSFLIVIIGVESFTYAAFLGLAQGLLLARVFVARSAAGLWFVGNLVAAVVVLIVTQIRIAGVSDQTNQTAVDLLLQTAIPGALYAAVTGIVLVALPRRDRKGAAPVAG
jgi:hypothetical protein